MATTIDEKNDNVLFGGAQRVAWDWESSTGGVVTSQTLHPYTGKVYQAVFLNDTGDATPTTAYDVTVTDEDDIDVLSGNGADVSSTGGPVYKKHTDGLGVVVYSKLTLNVSAAGDSKGGKVVLSLSSED